MSTSNSRARASLAALALTAFLGVAAAASAQPFPDTVSPPPVAAPSQAAADTSAPTLKSLVRDIGSDFAHLPTMSNLGAAIVGSGLALAAHQVDPDVNRHLYGKGSVHNFFLPGKVAGLIPVHIGVGVLAYTVGHETNRPRVEHIGLHLMQAQVVAGILTLGLKKAVRRERPDHSDNTSFPSGHASVTFATASVLARHLGWRAAAPTYLLAAYVSASRLHENRHYLSDVVAGATVGYIAGRTVTRRGRQVFTMVPMIDRHGAALVMVRTW